MWDISLSTLCSKLQHFTPKATKCENTSGETLGGGCAVGGGGGQETSDGRQAALRAAEVGKMPRRKKGPTRSRLCAAMALVMGRSGGRYQHSDRVAGVRGQSVRPYRVTE